MPTSTQHISVCVCTYKRPHLLKRLLEKLCRQETSGLFTYSIVVADNDSLKSAGKVIADFSESSEIEIRYCVEPRQNIALARNRAIENARGDYVAFIDDDEFPADGWLRNLFMTCKTYNVAGVLGPVMPYFEHEPAQWLLDGKFFERPTYKTGYRISMSEARTGNVLFLRSILAGVKEPFRLEFGTGGEDIDFFARMMEKGDAFIWCNEAIVYELVTPERCTRQYFVRKALLRGKNILKIPTGRAGNLFKSLMAIPLYGVALPIIFLVGKHHLFMRYLIKFCDHAGRILALLHMNPVREKV